MESKRNSSAIIKKATKPSLIFFILLFVINIFLFREMIFKGKVPVAFDYGIYNYQPWKIDFEEAFTAAPKRIGHDDIKIFYPQRKLIVESLKKGKIPFWNPYEFIGNVSLANSQTAIFYPPFLLFLLLPQITAWSLLSFSIPIIAGTGLYLFLTKIIKNKTACIFGAIIFAFSSSIITRSQDGLVAGHSIIWLPWALYGIEVLARKQKILGSIIVITSLIFSILAGWFQFTFYVYAVAFTYYYFISFLKEKQQRNLRSLISFLILFLIPIILTSFHWLPALEALGFSPRGILGTPPEFSIKHLMPISHLITLIIPNFFGHIASNTYFGVSEFKEGVVAIGLVPFIFSLTGIFYKEKSSRKKYFILLFLTSLLLAIKTPIASAMLNLQIPLLSTFLPNRTLILATFSLSVLAAFGYKAFLNDKNRSLKWIIKIVGSLFILLYLSTVTLYIYEKVLAKYFGFSLFEKGIERYVRISIIESLLPLSFFLVFLFILYKSKRKLNTKLVIIIFLLTIISQVYRANRYLYFSYPSHEFPDSPIISFLQEQTKENKSRFISLSYSRISSNIPSYYQLFFPEGIDAMYPIWYGEFADFFDGKEILTEDVLRIETTFSEELERRRWLQPKTINLISHLGIKYIVIPKEAFHIIPPEPAFEKVFEHKWHTVYEYKYAFPRAYFVPNANVINDKTATLQRIFHPMFFKNQEVILAKDNRKVRADTTNTNWIDISNIDLVEKQQKNYEKIRKDPYETARQIQQLFTENPVTITDYNNNKVTLRADIKEDGYIVLSDSYFPGWTAEVDGNESEIFRANHTFRAIPIKKGQHNVVFKYHPKSFTTGVKIASITMIFLIIMLGLNTGINLLNKNENS